MNTFFLTILFSGLFLFGNAQDSLRVKLTEVYSTEIVESILSKPQRKAYFTKLIFHSFKLTSEIKSSDPTSIQVLNSIDYKNIDGTHTALTPQEVSKMIKSGNFNIMRANLERKQLNKVLYKLGNTNEVLILSSYEQINALAKK